MRDELTPVQGFGAHETLDETGQDVVGHCEEDEFGIRRDLRRGPDRHPRKECLRAQSGQIRHRRDGSDVVTGTSQGRTEDGAGTTGTDDPDTQPRRLRTRAHVRERRRRCSARARGPHSRALCQDGRVPTDVLLAIGSAAGLPCDEVLEIDPRHPSLHPGFQLHVTRDQGLVVSADPRPGLMHRSAEKLFESRDLRQAMLLADRHDWLSPFTSEMVAALAIEEALGLLPPERATWIRLLMAEVERISATLPFLAVVAGPARRDVEETRARIIQVLESITGARMHPGFARIGGVAAWIDDVDRAALREVLDGIGMAHASWTEAVTSTVSNLQGLAVLTRDAAIGFGLGGPVGRASGVDLDLRRSDPYLTYAEVADLIEVPLRTEGDAAARALVMLAQIPVSRRLALATLDRLDALGAGPVDVPLPKVVRLPEGITYRAVEGPLGISGVLLVGAGDKYPWRMKIRSASFATMQAMSVGLVGTPMDRLPDAVMSWPIVLGDVDR